MRTAPPDVFTKRPEAQPFDPLRLCVFTTIALLAWLLTPPLMVAVMSGLAIVAYARARRAGLLKSRCLLGDTRLVLVYLTVAFVLGAAFTLWNATQLIGS